MSSTFTVPNEPLNIPQYLQTQLCSKCNTAYPNFITDCKHLFHYQCFFQEYYYFKHCPECHTSLNIPEMRTLNYQVCFACKTNKNILPCNGCWQSVCFVCLQTKPLNQCCSSLKACLLNTSILCPGCECAYSYLDFIPVRCGDHEVLCKKCWNSCFLNKKCLFGCTFTGSEGLYISCSTCESTQLKHFSNKLCQHDCEVCSSCMDLHNLTAANPNICPYCSKPMVEKQSVWLD
jgi:hypothetical protein